MAKEKQKKFGKPKSFSRISNSQKDPLQKTSFLSKILGNQKNLDEARKTFFTAYSFETNINPLRIITLFLFIAILMCFGMFFIEKNNENIYKNWKYQGITSIPPTSAINFDLVIEFSQKEDFLDCNSSNPKELLEGTCDTPLIFVNEMDKSQSRSQFLYIFQFLLMFLLFFPLGTFFHRSLRNIKTLKYKSSVSPEKSIVWIYFAIFLYFLSVFISRFISKDFNLAFLVIIFPLLFLTYRIFKTFSEIYKGSIIQKKDKIFDILSNRCKLWFLSFISVMLFNPSIITRFWAYNSDTVNDLIEGTRLMYFSSIILIIFCFISISLVSEIYKLQEIKNIKTGSIIVDPLQ